MQIFVLDTNPKKCAQYHNDKHIVKMPVETAQILCSVHHVMGSSDVPYRLTHKDHPCSVWARKSKANYIWLTKLGLELCAEYTRRYSKIHKSEKVIRWCIENIPDLPDDDMTEFAYVMPDIYKISSDAVTNYREFYMGDKRSIAKWKTQKPYWYE